MTEKRFVNSSIYFMAIALLAVVLQTFQEVLRPLAIVIILVGAALLAVILQTFQNVLRPFAIAIIPRRQGWFSRFRFDIRPVIGNFFNLAA